MNKRLTKRVLLIGWDGADWKIINQLLDAGQMPALHRFINEGTMGNIATLKPTLSPVLWSTIATGKLADQHGILGFLEALPDGSGVRPVSSESLKCKPLWNIVEDSGLKSGVVGWFATHPADQARGMVVSDSFRMSRGMDFDHWPLPPRSVSPETLTDIMRDMRLHPDDLDQEQVLFFIPEAKNIDQKEDHRLEAFARLLCQCVTLHSAATYIAEKEQWDMLAVYFDFIDRASHHFMEFRPPLMAHVSSNDAALYGQVVDAVYRFHDMMLARYMSIVDDDTTVIIISDHGFHSDHLRPAGGANSSFKNPVSWHRGYGIFAARGPGIKKDEIVFGASLLDVAPTVLHLLGLPVAQDMEGKALTQILETPDEPTYIETYEDSRTTEATLGASIPEDPAAVQMSLNQLADLGYIEPVPKDAAKAIDQVTISNLSTLAEVHIQAGKYDKGVQVLEDLLEKRPQDRMIKIKLAQCRLRQGKIEECRKIVDEFLADNPDAPRAHMIYGQILFAEDKCEEALDHFHKAEENGPNLPELHNNMGWAYLKQRHWDEAQRVFQKALEMDSDNANAYRGLGAALFQQKRYEDAIENLLRSIGLLYYQPKAHYQLGLCLAAMGSIDEAIVAFHRVLDIAPGMTEAHRMLVKLYRENGDTGLSVIHRVEADKIQGQQPGLQENIETQEVVGSEEEWITVVTGLPRSGTSMMMQMLQAGGMEVLSDGVRKADTDNPKGYFEFEKVKALKRDISWLNEGGGKAVKIIYSLMYDLPATHQYRILLMKRNMDEVLASQKKMLIRSGKQANLSSAETLKTVFEKGIEKVNTWFSGRSNMIVLDINYNDVVKDPLKEAQRINKFLGEKFNISKMAAVVDKTLYRQRK